MSPLPGGELATRPLHFIWIADCSGSMSVEGKIQSLNFAIQNALPAMRAAADENPNANLLVRALKFSSGAQWHVSHPTPVAAFQWEDLSAEGVTDLGHALKLVADELKMPPMTDRALPPVLVLLSDGQPTDDFQSGMKALMDLPWGKKSVRLAIAIGQDADLDVLQKFIGHAEIKPMQANNADALVRFVKWVSTVVVKTVSSPPSQLRDSATTSSNVTLPPPPDSKEPTDATDPW